MASTSTSSKGPVTRSVSDHSLFGQPEVFSGRQLPTKEEVVKCYLFYRKMVPEEGKETPSTRDVLKYVANDLVSIWNKASIPVIGYSSVVGKLQKLIELAQQLQKYPPAKRTSLTFKADFSNFKQVFDICSCKCVRNKIVDRQLCKCATKVSQIEWNFWVDQASVRKMVIGPIDKIVSSSLQKKTERKNREERFRKKYLESPITSKSNAYQFSFTEENEASDVTLEDEPLYQPSTSDSEDTDSETRLVQNRHQYPNLSQMMERTGVSNRDACKLINACLKDLKLDKPENILEPTKLRRQRIYWRDKGAESRSFDLRKLVCVGFDGRIDETRLFGPDGGQLTKKEDHYAIIAYPSEQYVDHIAPQSGKAEDISKEILSVIRDTDSTDTLCAVICDGTNTNTGEHSGIIRRLETTLNRPLQWLICMLHLNELPVREIFKNIDGKTTGPKGFSGPIGKMLNFDPRHLPIVDFQPVTGNVKELCVNITKDFSADQKYLLKASIAVQKGKQNSDAAAIKCLQTASPGTLNHARWLTLANRTLRLFMGTKSPSRNLLQLVTYIVRVYAPSWFEIKTHSNCTDGSRNFHFILEKVRNLPDREMQEAAIKSLQLNCYFAHSENILLAALADPDIEVRKDAVNKIIVARTINQAGVRKFCKSNIMINREAETYYNMIDWDVSVITPPPLVNSVTNEELLAKIEIGPLEFIGIQCHSQAVERVVKEVSRVSTKVVGHKARHGMIASSEESRRKFGILDTKHAFLKADN